MTMSPILRVMLLADLRFGWVAMMAGDEPGCNPLSVGQSLSFGLGGDRNDEKAQNERHCSGCDGKS